MLSTLFFFLLLFLRPGAADPPGSGVCAGLLCSYRLSEDFRGAQDTCRTSGGELLTLDPEDGTDLGLVRVLLGGGGARYWVRSSRGGPDGLSVSWGSLGGGAVTPEPRTHTLDGFVCRYQAQDVCGPLLVHGGSHVNYSSVLGFQMLDEQMFPPGTTAVTRSPGSAQPDSKHLCFSTWVRAPWSCEVMDGGCEHGCTSTSTPPQCSCSPGHVLHPNGFSCSHAPCADCALPCAGGYERAPDGTCVDVDECDTGDACTAEGEECVNTEGGYQCTCADGFDVDDGACVNVSICNLCEHMDCRRVGGVYQCACRSGFRVSPSDPTKCEQHCTQRDCPSRCVPPTGTPQQCFCPHGYVTDTRVNVTICTDINECDMEQPCDHLCENLWGGFRCSCRAGFDLHGDYRCVRVKEEEFEEEEEEGSGGTPAPPQAASLPSYIKTGSVLGIAVFMALCGVLLYLLWRHAHRRCGRFELSTFKHPDLDIYYLTQVTTETYKRLSLDRQSGTDQTHIDYKNRPT